jgi:hypothetical protein
VLAQFDEYPCFSLDVGLSEDAFVTTFEVTPGNQALVHHAVLMLLDPAAPSRLEGLNNEQAIDRLRQRDPNPTREGWPIESSYERGPAKVRPPPAKWSPGHR